MFQLSRTVSGDFPCVSAHPAPPAPCPLPSLLFALHFFLVGWAGEQGVPGWATSPLLVAKGSAKRREGRKEKAKKKKKE